MKHATSRLLFAYWDGLRGERSAPDRAEIRPGDIRQILADTFILGTRPDGSPVFRLAGTRCGALFGQDLKGVPFEALWDPANSRDGQALTDAVLSDTSGAVAGLVATGANGARLALELILLPLKHRGSLNSRALGALSPVSVPSWLGLVPVTAVETQSIRIIGPGGAVPPAPSVPPHAGGRARFVVHEGGLGR